MVTTKLRWYIYCYPQTFTPGTAPVSGYESINFVRGITATQSAAGDFAIISQRIEDVRTDAGSTVTISFWAKANTGTPKIGVELSQNFGSGGSPSAQVNTPAGAVTLSTSWARYSVSVAIPSISGKTIGTTANTSYLELNLWTSSGATNATRASSIGIQNFTADIWGVQVESGSTATAFQTATGTLAGELAACQRYYQSFDAGGGTTAFGQGFASSTTAAYFKIPLLSAMRVTPTTLDALSLRATDYNTGFNPSGSFSIYASGSSPTAVVVGATTFTGLTQFRTYFVESAGTTTSYLRLGAEL